MGLQISGTLALASCKYWYKTKLQVWCSFVPRIWHIKGSNVTWRVKMQASNGQTGKSMKRASVFTIGLLWTPTHNQRSELLMFSHPSCFQTPLGGIHVPETRKKFLEGSLHPANVLMCPHTCVTNLPKPREHRPDRDVTPSAVHVGNIVQGARMAWAQGRELSMSEEEGDGSKRVRS